MPLVIPASRNLHNETFNSYLISRHQNRIREEQRHRQEEAADEGGGALGGVIGTVIGGLLALPTGGASLSLAALGAGAAIGGGLGQAAGALVDPPGSAVPGGQLGQVNRGLSRATQGLLLESSRRVRESDKQEIFIAGLVEDFGPEAVKEWDTFQAEAKAQAVRQGQPAPAPSALRTAFYTSRGRQLGQIGQRAIAGRKLAEETIRRENQQIDAFRDIKTVAQLDKAFNVGPRDFETFLDLQTQEHLQDESERLGQADPRQLRMARRTLAGQRDDFARRIRLKPPPPISLQELQQSGAPAQIGTLYTDGPPDTAITAHSWTGRGWNSLPYGGGRNRVSESETLPGTFFYTDDDGKRTFHSKRVLDGQIVGPGDPWEHPSLGWVQFDHDGELDTIKGAGDDERDKLFKDVFVKALQAGLTADDAAAAGRKALQTLEGVEKIQEDVAFTRQLENAKSSDELVSLLASTDRRLANALEVMRKPQQASTIVLENAAIQIRISIEDLLEKRQVNDALRDRLGALVNTATDIALQRRPVRFGTRP